MKKTAKEKFRIYDNNGEGYGRFSVVIGDKVYRAENERLMVPTVFRYSSTESPKSTSLLGEEVSIDSVPESVKNAIRNIIKEHYKTIESSSNEPISSYSVWYTKDGNIYRTAKIQRLRRKHTSMFKKRLGKYVMALKSEERLRKEFVDTGKVSEERFNEIYNNTDTSPDKRYSEWLLNRQVKGELPDDTNEIKNIISDFYKLVSEDLINKEQENIYSYFSFKDLQNIVTPHNNKLRQIDEQNEYYKKIDEGGGKSPIIFQNDKVTVLKIMTKEESITVGRYSSTSWCISVPEGDNYFNRYIKSGKTIYMFVPRNPKIQRITVVAYPDEWDTKLNQSVPGGYEIRDRLNRPMSHEEFKKYCEKLGFPWGEQYLKRNEL